MDTYEVAAIGDLYKKSPNGRRKWNLREFALCGTTFIYYKNGEKRGEWDIAGCNVREITPKEARQPAATFAFTIESSKKQYILNANNSTNRDYWINKLEKQIFEFRNPVRRFIRTGEIVHANGLFTQKKSFFRSCPIRVVLTNFPRIILLDPVKIKLKGQYSWTMKSPPKLTKISETRCNIRIIGSRDKPTKEVLNITLDHPMNGMDYWMEMFDVNLLTTEMEIFIPVKKPTARIDFLDYGRDPRTGAVIPVESSASMMKATRSTGTGSAGSTMNMHSTEEEDRSHTFRQQLLNDDDDEEEEDGNIDPSQVDIQVAPATTPSTESPSLVLPIAAAAAAAAGVGALAVMAPLLPILEDADDDDDDDDDGRQSVYSQYSSYSQYSTSRQSRHRMPGTTKRKKSLVIQKGHIVKEVVVLDNPDIIEQRRQSLTRRSMYSQSGSSSVVGMMIAESENEENDVNEPAFEEATREGTINLQKMEVELVGHQEEEEEVEWNEAEVDDYASKHDAVFINAPDEENDGLMLSLREPSADRLSVMASRLSISSNMTLESRNSGFQHRRTSDSTSNAEVLRHLQESSKKMSAVAVAREGQVASPESHHSTNNNNDYYDSKRTSDYTKQASTDFSSSANTFIDYPDDDQQANGDDESINLFAVSLTGTENTSYHPPSVKQQSSAKQQIQQPSERRTSMSGALSLVTGGGNSSNRSITSTSCKKGTSSSKKETNSTSNSSSKKYNDYVATTVSSGHSGSSGGVTTTEERGVRKFVRTSFTQKEEDSLVSFELKQRDNDSRSVMSGVHAKNNHHHESDEISNFTRSNSFNSSHNSVLTMTPLMQRYAMKSKDAWANELDDDENDGNNNNINNNKWSPQNNNANATGVTSPIAANAVNTTITSSSKKNNTAADATATTTAGIAESERVSLFTQAAVAVEAEAVVEQPRASIVSALDYNNRDSMAMIKDMKEDSIFKALDNHHQSVLALNAHSSSSSEGIAGNSSNKNKDSSSKKLVFTPYSQQQQSQSQRNNNANDDSNSESGGATVAEEESALNEVSVPLKFNNFVHIAPPTTNSVKSIGGGSKNSSSKNSVSTPFSSLPPLLPPLITTINTSNTMNNNKTNNNSNKTPDKMASVTSSSFLKQETEIQYIGNSRIVVKKGK